MEEENSGSEENKSSEEVGKESEEKSEVRIDNNPDKIRVSEVKEKVQKNPWVVSTWIFVIISIVLLVMVFRGGLGDGTVGTGNVISADEASDLLMEYLNSRTGGGVEYISYEDLGNIYEVNVEYQGQELPVFITKDGEYFVQGAVPLSVLNSDVPDNSSNTPTQTPTDVPKSDKPVVELFVMTHCPYGTQAEKGFVPTIETLGDTIDSSVKFVHYFLHAPEEEETPRQICIREEQPDKFVDYLKCFLEDGEAERCLEEVGIDQTKLNECIDTNAEGYYDTDSVLSEGYGVRGSPTLVVNGVIANSGRSSAAYLDTICSAFNEAPEECLEELSAANPSAGFGYNTDGTPSAASAAQC